MSAAERKGRTATGSGSDDLGLLYIASLAARHRWFIVGLAISVGAATALVSLFLTPKFTAQATFVPEQGEGASLPVGVSALAGQFGISIPSEPGESPHFYASVLRSRELTEAVLLSRFAAPSGAGPETLMFILDRGGDSRADSLYRARREVARSLGVDVDDRTGLVTLNFSASDPGLAAAVVNRYLTLLNEFNLESRQSHAERRRVFVEARSEDALDELRQAEQRLATFLRENRRWEQSPQLEVEHGRLERDLQVTQELYLTLRRELELARVAAVNDVPVLTVVDEAAPPARRSFPRRTMMVAIGIVVGLMLGLASTFMHEYARGARASGSHLSDESGGARSSAGAAVER